MTLKLSPSAQYAQRTVFAGLRAAFGLVIALVASSPSEFSQ